MSIHIHGIPILSDNYSWLIIHDQACLIIDPGEAAPILSTIQALQLTPKAILITHHHWDHTDGIDQVISQYPDIPVIAAEHEPVTAATQFYPDKHIIQITNFPDVQLHLAPGHTKHHCLFALCDNLFTGDTLFAGGCGRAFESEPETLWQSLLMIKQFPENTKIYAGHEYTYDNLVFAHHVLKNNPSINEALTHAAKRRQLNIPTLPSTLAHELKTNIFLMCDNPAIWPEINSNQPINDAATCFKFLRNWKNNFFSGKIAQP